MDTSGMRKDQPPSAETETHELKPGLGFTEDARYVLSSNSREEGTETPQTEPNNLNASQSFLCRSCEIVPTNKDTFSPETALLAKSNDESKMCSHAICSEDMPSSKCKDRGKFAVDGNIDYDYIKNLNGLGDNKVDSGTADGHSEELAEFKHDKTHTNLDKRETSLDEEHVSKVPVPSTQTTVSLRKDNSLPCNDLEQDAICAIDCKQAVLKDAPDCVPDNLPGLTLQKSSGPGCLLGFWKEQAKEETEVYIQHDKATDSRLGDKFGASVKTFSTRATDYYEHFFTDIEKEGVADHMKIKPGDQLVLLNGVFVPSLGHEEVLERFSNVPVDSHTRLSLIILRSVSKKLGKKKWEWIDTSAILVPEPEYSKEPPAVKDPVYSTSLASSHEERGLFNLKVQGTQMFVTISDGHVRLEVSDTGGDVDRFNICVWTRCALDESTGQVSYTASLYRTDPHQCKHHYVTINETTEVITKTNPQWFEFGSLGRSHSFKDKGRNEWLGCDVSNHATCGKFRLEKRPYFFYAYAVENQLYLRSDRRSGNRTMGFDEIDRSDNYSYVSHRESSSGLNTDNEGTDVDGHTALSQ